MAQDPETRLVNKASLIGKTFPCFCCGKELEFATGWDYENVSENIELKGPSLKFTIGVSKGLPFHTSGAWGSQVADMDKDIIFIICDECIVRNSERALCTNWYQHYNTDKVDIGPYDIFNAREEFEKAHKEIQDKDLDYLFIKPPTT